MHIQACPECLETRDLVDGLGQKFDEVVASLKNIKELGQASNETNQSLSEQITGLETTVEGLKTAAENSKQDSAKLVELQQQIGTLRTTMDDFTDSLTCKFENHDEKISTMTSLIDKQSLKSQANEEKLNLLSAQLESQTKRADKIEGWNARLHQESISYREKQAEQDIDRSEKIEKALEAAEEYSKISRVVSALVDRVRKLETETLSMHQYDVLLTRLIGLEIQGASKTDMNELRYTMLQLDKATAKTSQLENVIERSDNIAERVNLIESTQPSASVIEQATKQIGIIDDLTRIAGKMEHLQKTEAQSRSKTSNSTEVLDMTLRANLKTLSAHHEDIISLQQEAKLTCAVLQGLKDMMERFAKGVPHPFFRLPIRNFK